MPDSLYDTDILAWSQAQADRLRRLAAGERVNDLDWAHLIEEIEAVGRSELRSVRAFLGLALLHALKVVGWPNSPAVGHWKAEIANFLLQGRARFEPGMAQHLNLDGIMDDAVQRVRRLDNDGPSQPLPDGTDLSPAELLDAGFGPDDLIARLRPAAP